MNLDSKIWVAGHNGMVGSAILRKLKDKGYNNFLFRSSRELDLRNQAMVNAFFEEEKPEFVFLSAAKVGGILANNTYKADFIYDNLAIELNVIRAAYEFKVQKLLFLGSSCIYPKMASQPISEDSLLSGKLEPTNEPYAVAKIAGIKMCDAYREQYGCDFISAMPTNLYGPNDNYDLKNSHVLPALLAKMHLAKMTNSSAVEIWGTGTPRREFLHVDDLADACLFLMDNFSDSGIVNVGNGSDVSIKELAELIKSIVGYKGSLDFDTSKPDGTPRKLLNVSKMESLGWRFKIGLEEGVRHVYEQALKKGIFS
jgi:GDP-L-fucose synthase